MPTLEEDLRTSARVGRSAPLANKAQIEAAAMRQTLEEISRTCGGRAARLARAVLGIPQTPMLHSPDMLP